MSQVFESLEQLPFRVDPKENMTRMHQHAPEALWFTLHQYFSEESGMNRIRVTGGSNWTQAGWGVDSHA